MADSTLAYAENRLATMVQGGVTTSFTFHADNRWRTGQGPSGNPDAITFAYTGSGRLSTYNNEDSGVSAIYSYDSVGQRIRSAVTETTGEAPVTTTTDYVYTGLTLRELRATQNENGSPTAGWSITYLYDEAGKPYAGVYRDTTDPDPENRPAPTLFHLVTTDRGDVVSLLDKNGAPFAAYRYDAWGRPVGEATPASVVRCEEDDTALIYTGTWTPTENEAASGSSFTSATPTETGASVTYQFTGTSLAWITSTSAAQGIASVTLDGGTPQTVDLYSATPLYQQSVWTSGTLSEGAHTLVIAWTGTKNPDSSAATISVDALDVTGVPGEATGIWAQATPQTGTPVVSLALATKISERQVLRYAGYCFDSESGMYYLSARHYDPETRLFLSKDPSRADGEQSAYQYCLGNPVELVDPTGFDAWYYHVGRGVEDSAGWVNDEVITPARNGIGDAVDWSGRQVWRGATEVANGAGWLMDKGLYEGASDDWKAGAGVISDEISNEIGKRSPSLQVVYDFAHGRGDKVRTYDADDQLCQDMMESPAVLKAWAKYQASECTYQVFGYDSWPAFVDTVYKEGPKTYLNARGITGGYAGATITPTDHGTATIRIKNEMGINSLFTHFDMLTGHQTSNRGAKDGLFTTITMYYEWEWDNDYIPAAQGGFL